ncbi:MAG: LPS assembly lipoprotein LptE [Rhodospirillales bacterium]|nr:LPS assembly lipoprotein LptE [Rhodospirillales bacterium]
MSSLDRPLFPRATGFRRGKTPVLVLALSLVLLAACSVEPLYGSRSSKARGGGVAAIEIAPIKDRVGHVVRNHLIDSLTPAGQPAHPDYRLTFAIEREKTPLLIQLDDHATRFNLTLRARFALADRDGTVVYRDSARATGGYNVVESGFATVAAERDAAEEAARVLSEEILTLILLHLRR